jgi:hypothetical protein
MNRFKTEEQLLASGWKWHRDTLMTRNAGDNTIPREMLNELAGQPAPEDHSFWSITPGMVLSEVEIAKEILKQYEDKSGDQL